MDVKDGDGGHITNQLESGIMKNRVQSGYSR